MKSFFKNIASSCLGSLLALFVIALLGFVVVKSYLASGKASQKGILHLTLTGVINDYSNSNFDIANLDFGISNTSLWDIRKKLDAAAVDKNIKGLLIEFENVELSQQMASELGKIISDFRATGKKIFSYSNYYSQNAYYLSTYSDSIFVNPNGGVDLKGYAIYSPFFKNILDKYQIDINIYFAGKYKSATEPYRRNSFSDENELQLREYLTQLYANLTQTVAINRDLKRDKIAEIIDARRVYDADFMASEKIVDKVAYRDEVIGGIKVQFDKSELIPFADYVTPEKKVDKHVAVVFAQGEITWGNSSSGGITPDRYSKIFQKIRKDKDIKKVILRIDSPGGNGYVSDILHREIELTRKEGKKVYASFGSYATSGAYYIASACDSIFATSNVMTGSIGVYIMIPTFDRFLDSQFDIKVDSVLSNRAALSYSPLVGISESQGEQLKSQTDKLYQKFLSKVVQGRDLSLEEVQKVAQGRIWTGASAKSIGLVDEIKTLDELLDEMSINGLPKVYPESNSLFPESLIKNGLGKIVILQNSKLNLAKSKLVEFQKLIENPSPNMRLPMSIFVTNQ